MSPEIARSGRLALSRAARPSVVPTGDVDFRMRSPGVSTLTMLSAAACTAVRSGRFSASVEGLPKARPDVISEWIKSTQNVPGYYEMLQFTVIDHIEDFLLRNKMRPADFGRLVANNPMLISDLKNGEIPDRQTIEKIYYLMAKYKKPVVNFEVIIFAIFVILYCLFCWFTLFAVFQKFIK